MTETTIGNSDDAAVLARHGLDSVAGAFAYSGGQELVKANLGLRRRVRLNLTDGAGASVSWYLKCYDAPPTWKRLCRWFVGRGKRGPARREFENVRRLNELGIPSMRAVAMGEESDLLGVRRGYLVVSAVPGEALERCFDEFLTRHGADSTEVGAFTAALADLVARLHAAGLVHRDLYAAHIFLERSEGPVKLYLIDLARVFRPRWRRFRWRVKDLAALKYSMPAAWVDRHWETFLRDDLSALGGPEEMDRCRRAVERKLACMRRRQRRKDGRS